MFRPSRLTLLVWVFALLLALPSASGAEGPPTASPLQREALFRSNW